MYDNMVIKIGSNWKSAPSWNVILGISPPFVDHQRVEMIVGICTSTDYKRSQESKKGKYKQ